MKFNLKKANKIAYDHTDKGLADQRDDMNHHNTDGEGSYDRLLDENRSNKEIIDITEKQLGNEDPNADKTIEARMDDKRQLLPGNWRDDRTHKTNTLPINELAEERQRKRMKDSGLGDGFETQHFQEYKKENLDLTHANFADLSDVINEIDKVYTATSIGRVTTSEKIKIKALTAKRNKILNGLQYENRNS